MPAAVKAELNFTNDIAEGATGIRARRVQEWLTFARFGTPIDGDFGSATKRAVTSFQAARGLPARGVVDKATWNALTSPLADLCALSMDESSSVDIAVLAVAKAHLAVHPIELGGDNRGPWVRVYCGADGIGYKWCAGFVTFVIKHACSLIAKRAPLPGSLSCDSLAAQAKENGRFVRGKDLETGARRWSELGQVQVFLVRRTASDWTHTGFSFDGKGSTFDTIEGNTNDQGSSDGFEVCRRSRSIRSKDFIVLK